MAFRLINWKRRSIRGRTTQQWVSLAETLQREAKAPSQSLRDEALRLYRNLGSILQLSDPRVARARAELDAAAFHPGTDWRWRPGVFYGPVTPMGLVEPEGGEKLGDEIALWHDCENKALILRQVPNSSNNTPVPYGLRLETLSFSGEYLSLSLDLPISVLEWLGKSHVMRLDLQIYSEFRMEIYGRLNMAQGPNTEQVLRKIDSDTDPHQTHRVIEFDLAYTDLAERPVEKVWLDLIFNTPYMNVVNLHDLMLSRYPRAEV